MLLTDLPAELKESIANALDYKSKMSLRQVTKAFKKAVDNSHFFYESLFLEWNLRRKTIIITVNLNSDGEAIVKELEFVKKTENRCLVRNRREQWEKEVNVNYMDAAMEHFWKILKHPSKIHLKLLNLKLQRYLGEVDDSLGRFHQKFQLIRPKLLVKELKIAWGPDPEPYLHVISSLKPGILKTLNFSHISDYSRIAETEQWRKAEELCAWVPEVIDTSHFVRFTWNQQRVELNEMRELVEQFFLHPKWQSRHIVNCSFPSPSFKEQFFGSNDNVIRRGRDACRIEFNRTDILITRITD